jgi:DNA-binding transcriptional LysR family regulator
LAQTRFLIVAAPSYWEEFGMPAEPAELRNHQCVTLRLLKRAIMDHWEFERDGVRESVPVSGWMVSDDRDWIFEAVKAGVGVTRVPDLVALRYIESGELVPALLPWQVAEAPPVLISYRRELKNVPRVRVLVQFLAEVFEDLNLRRAVSPQQPEPMPSWFAGRHTGRTSVRVKR